MRDIEGHSNSGYRDTWAPGGRKLSDFALQRA